MNAPSLDPILLDLADRLAALRLPWRAESMTGAGIGLSRPARDAVLAEVRAVLEAHGAPDATTETAA